ncbi:hypothetical protein NP493_83g05023 [Ridgeia piscesae]|uniref:Uncharacterized protein n=1 Tax=Ridgeia piscesae TaxID=27915 RepID=A0AAD9P920_RIDPI|nr:hypothetical protein NP493_83g05023 [Ridgeia piscesae]
MAALSFRVCPCLLLFSFRLSSRSNADASASYRRVDSMIARYIFPLICKDT